MYSSCLFTLHLLSFFFFNDTATTEIYTLSLHDALPIFPQPDGPSSTTNLPFSARKLTASTACTAPKRFDTLSRTISDTRLPRGGTDQQCDAKYCIRILRDGRRAA